MGSRDTPYEAIALASWTLLGALLHRLTSRGVLAPDERRAVMESALEALERPRPDGADAEALAAARRWLEDWL